VIARIAATNIVSQAAFGVFRRHHASARQARRFLEKADAQVAASIHKLSRASSAMADAIDDSAGVIKRATFLLVKSQRGFWRRLLCLGEGMWADLDAAFNQFGLHNITAVRLKVEQNQLVDVFGEIGVLIDGLKGA
jgi:hypothetical protein